MIDANHRHCFETEFQGSSNAAMSRNDVIRAVDQHRDVEAKCRDRAGNRGNLGWLVKARIAGVGNEARGRDVLNRKTATRFVQR